MFEFPKTERLCGKTAIGNLMEKGHWGTIQPLKFCYLKRGDGQSVNRVMFSVPKKYFKRAVMRNLIKRHLRESYRLQKSLLGEAGVDLMIVYNAPEVMAFDFLREEVERILKEVSRLVK